MAETVTSLELQLLLDQQLIAGERVLWAGRPDPRRLAGQLVPVLLVGLFVIGFMIAWMGTAAGWTLPNLRKGFGIEWVGLVFALLGLPGLWFGLRLLGGPLWSLRNARRTLYVVTDRRALILDASSQGKPREFLPARLRKVVVKRRPDGSGSILFRRSAAQPGETPGFDGAGFLGLDDPAGAEAALRQLGACLSDAGQTCKRVTVTDISRYEKDCLPPRARIVFGLLFAAFGAVFLAIFGVASSLECTRISPERIDGVIHRTWMWIVPLPDRPVENLLQADLEEGVDGDGGTTWQIVLRTAREPVYLGYGSSSGMADKQAVVQQINTFLADADAVTLTVEAQSAGWGALAPLVFIAAGLLLIAGGVRATHTQRRSASGAGHGGQTP